MLCRKREARNVVQRLYSGMLALLLFKVVLVLVCVCARARACV
jgi:hypothetical protein